MLRVDEEETEALLPEERRKLKMKIRELLPGADAVIFEDYDKGVLDRDIIKYTIGLAEEMGKPTIVDPKKKNFNAYRGATLFKPNLKEIREGLRIDLEKGDMEGLKTAVHTLREKLMVNQVMVTLSESGILISADGKDTHIPAHVRLISDVSGAGDTVVSIAALCLSLELPPPMIAALSNLGGGLVCEQLGVVPVDRQQLLEEARQHKLDQYLRA